MTATMPKRPNQRDARTPSNTRRAPGPVRAVTAAILMSFLAIALVAAQEATPGSTPAATPAAGPTPSADMPRLELALEELNDSGIGGTVTLYDAGEQVIVEFDAEGAGGDHPTHIHAGVCGELDPEPAFPLENVDENGESTTVVDTTLDELLAGDFAIDLHLTPDQLGTLIACANIDGEPTVPEGAAGTPASTPEATPDTTAEPTEEADGTGGTTGEEISDGTSGAEATDDQIARADEPATEPSADTPADTTAPTTATTIPQPPSTSDADGTGGAVAALPKPEQPIVGGDGTAGISGTGGPVATQALPQQAGVGAALAWPTEPATAAIWASAAGAVVLGASAMIVRRGERLTTHTPSRWSRLGV